MTVTAWRICKRRYAATAFDGEGAKRFGGRLNSKGVAIVYTAESVALAALEMLVHLESADLLARYLVRSARFDDSLVSDLDRRKLPKSWRQSPTPASQAPLAVELVHLPDEPAGAQEGEKGARF